MLPGVIPLPRCVNWMSEVGVLKGSLWEKARKQCIVLLMYIEICFGEICIIIESRGVGQSQSQSQSLSHCHSHLPSSSHASVVSLARSAWA